MSEQQRDPCAALRACFQAVAPIQARDGVIAAFSGGPDSLALLLALTLLQRDYGLRVIAAHLDHGLDPQSRQRAEQAMNLARQLEVVVDHQRIEVDVSAHGDGVEAAARSARYGFLEECRQRHQARYIFTAHHLDDQAETVLLRMSQGSSLLGLAAIQARRGALVRPFLATPRRQLASWLAQHAPHLTPVIDPTNRDWQRPRNRVRHFFWQQLELLEPKRAGAGAGARADATSSISTRLVRVAERVASLRPSLERRLLTAVNFRAGDADDSRSSDAELDPTSLPSIDIEALMRLPSSLYAPTLAAFHRRAGAVYPATAGALRELRRQLAASQSPVTQSRASHLPATPATGLEVACDCGRGWSWRGKRGRLHLSPASLQQRKPASLAFFSYTTSVPGSLRLPQLSLQLSVRRSSPEEWRRYRRSGASVARLDSDVDAMSLLRPESRAGSLVLARAFLELPIAEGAEVTVRNRRAGDRLQPLGCAHQKRLKEILIDRRVPRALRNSLPLLCVEDHVVWVPTVTLDHRFRVTGKRNLWIAEWTSTAPRADGETSQRNPQEHRLHEELT